MGQASTQRRSQSMLTRRHVSTSISTFLNNFGSMPGFNVEVKGLSST